MQAAGEVGEGDELTRMLEQVGPLLAKYLDDSTMGREVVSQGLAPEAMRARLNLELPAQAQGMEGVMAAIEEALQLSVRTNHPLFMDKLYAGADPVGMVGELVTAALNTNMHVYYAAPALTLIELATLKALGQLFGFSDPDGITCPGGSFSNMLALHTARHRVRPDIKQSGMSDAGDLVILTSAQGHYSVEKGACLLGFGLDRVIKVPCDSSGAMIPGELDASLRRCRAAGQRPFFINATSGTTVFGAYDPLTEIAAIARVHGCWLHIDACWGGSVVFSPRHAHLMRGSQSADSIAWNAHKALGLPIQMSVLLVRERGLLRAANGTGAQYLFHDNPYDQGDKTMQCGRRPDIFKLYLSWRHHGSEGFAARIDAAFNTVNRFVELLRSDGSPDFVLAQQPAMFNVCFWFIPKRLRDMPDGASRDAAVNELTVALHGTLIRLKLAYIDYAPDPNGGPAFFRIVLAGRTIREQDLRAVIAGIRHADAVVLAA